MSSPPASRRDVLVLTSESNVPPSTVSTSTLELRGSGALRISEGPTNSSTAATQPGMPAVAGAPAPSAPVDAPLPRRRQSSWVDAHPEDPITEQTWRPVDFEAPPESRDRAVLLRMDGVHAGQVSSLKGGSLSIGRHPDNDLVVDDTGVSRLHASLIQEDGSYFLIDRGSRNGTILQGRRIQRAELHDGDFVQLGPHVSFRFTLTDEKQERLLHRLYESSNRDALTSAYNRKHFDERLLSEIAYSVRHGTPTALLLFDIDHFKRVNDTYGHGAGDAVLRQVAGIVKSRLRAEDVFARVGGEEFAVLLRGVNLAGCVRLAERLRTSVSALPALYEGRTIGVTISIGCATLECAGTQHPTDLARLADQRLYKAKTGGRNRTVSS